MLYLENKTKIDFNRCSYLLALVYVPAIVFIDSQSIPSGTLTVERSQTVSTPSVSAEVGHHVAFVHIYAIVLVAQLKTVVTTTLERAVYIDASAVVADVRMPDALVYVNAVVTGGGEQIARVADALEAALEVLAFAV